MGKRTAANLTNRANFYAGNPDLRFYRFIGIKDPKEAAALFVLGARSVGQIFQGNTQSLGKLNHYINGGDNALLFDVEQVAVGNTRCICQSKDGNLLLDTYLAEIVQDLSGFRFHGA
jgi:hypothetical protein